MGSQTEEILQTFPGELRVFVRAACLDPECAVEVRISHDSRHKKAVTFKEIKLSPIAVPLKLKVRKADSLIIPEMVEIAVRVKTQTDQVPLCVRPLFQACESENYILPRLHSGKLHVGV